MYDARDLLTKAVAADPAYPLAHAALSDAWNHLGYTLKARAEIERARSLSGTLGPEEQLLIDGEYYSTIPDRPRAIDAYRKLYAQFPDDLDYGLRLADQQRWVSPQDALRTLEGLRNLPAPKGSDAGIDFGEARAWMSKDFVKSQAAARRAIEKGNAEGSLLLVARAYGVLCQTMGNGSSTAQGIQDCENARRGYAAVGDRDNEARTLSDSAGYYYQMGDLDRAERMYREAIVVFRRVGDVEGLNAASSNLGDVSLERGNLDAAESALREALPGYRERGDKDGTALTLVDLAEIARLRGNLNAALGSYKEARTIAQEIDDKSAVAYALFGVGDVFLDQGNLQAAQHSYAESLTLRKEDGEKQTVAETELAMARLSLEEGHAADAETVIRKCKEQFHQDGQADDELVADVILMEGLLGQDKFVEAADEQKASQPLAAKSTNELNRLQFELVSARVEMAVGHLAASRHQLEHTLDRAHTHHLLGVELETRLALAELRKKLGESVEAQADLIALEKAAHEKGFGVIAGKALSLRRKKRRL